MIQLNAKYLVFTKDTDPKKAAAIFEKRYGVAPHQIVIDNNGLLWVGPISQPPTTYSERTYTP